MQDYYNIIPTFGVGGLIAKIAKAAGRAKILGHANLLSKELPELAKLLSKLAKSLKGGPKLSDKEAERLATLALDYRRSNIHYLDRRKKINELLAAKRSPKQEVISPSAPQPNPVVLPAGGPYLNKYAIPPTPRTNKIRGTRNKRASQLVAVLTPPVLTPPVLSAPSGEVIAASPVPGTTLSARWQLAKTWMNNHPKLTIGVPLLALGTGPGRYITGNSLKATQSDPASWFGEQSLQAANALDFVMINGTKIPILRSLDGTFVPVLANSLPATSTDDLDAIIAEANNTPSNPAVPSLPGDPGYIDTSAINDLFDDDQWL